MIRFSLIVVGCMIAQTHSQSSGSIWREDICGTSKYADAGNMALPSPSIVGGIAAREYEFPWQVSLRSKSTNSHFCGGAIINDQWIITAAHCVVDWSLHPISVVVGEHRLSANSTVRQTFDVSAVVYHEEYGTPNRHQNDVALIRIDGNFTFSENVRPICPPAKGEPYTGRKCVVSGWGVTSYGSTTVSTYLRYVTLNVSTTSYCLASYSTVNGAAITPDMFCTTDNRGDIYRDSCQGDSGGPVTVTDSNGIFHLIGAVSWGERCASGYPGVNVRVNYFLDWIAAAVSNYVAIQPFALRLAGGGLPNEGRLEIFYSGAWGTVCEDSFEDIDARVACNSLGFGLVGRQIDNIYGAGVGPIWLDQVECYGTETSIDSCSHNAWGHNDCDHMDDISILCGQVQTTSAATTTTDPTDPTNPPVWMDDICGISKYADAGEMYLPSPAIVGGITAREYEFPWQVSLRLTSTNSHYCGGVIVNEQWILTAAQCVHGRTPSSLRVVVGQHDRTSSSVGERQLFDVSTIVQHEQYNRPYPSQNDIAIVRIYGTIQFTDNVRPICPPTAGQLYAGRKCQISGWGTLHNDATTSPSVLRYATLNVTTNLYCSAVYSNESTIIITTDMLCTTDNTGNTDRDSCQGDSGGPVTVKDSNGMFHLVGLVSFWNWMCVGLSRCQHTRRILPRLD